MSVQASACLDDGGVVHSKHGVLRVVSWAMQRCSAALPGSCQPFPAVRRISNCSSCSKLCLWRAVARRHCYRIPRFRSVLQFPHLLVLLLNLSGRFVIFCFCHQVLRRDIFLFRVRSCSSLRRLRKLPFCAAPLYRYSCSSR